MDSDFPHFNSSAQLPEGGVKQENVSESSSQLHDAMEALEAYQTAVCSELTEESVDASSKAISAAVKQLVAHHESEMQSLSHENAQLREQLSCASGLVDSLTAHLSLSTNATMRRSSALHTVAGSPASSSHPSSLPPSSSSSVAPRPTRLAEDTDSTGHHSEQPALVDSPLSDTAAVAEDAIEEDHVERLATLVDVALPTAELLTSEPGALEAFVAHYADLRGRVAHLLTEQRLWRHSLEQLTPLLRTMTVENANFRQTLTLLKATHVPIEALQEAVRERDEARRELRQLRLDAARLEHELADAEAQHSKQMLLQGQQQQGSAEALAAHKKSVSVSPAPEWPSAGVHAAASAPYPHDGEWAMAIRELEEQAIVAANQQLLRQQLADAQAETTRLQSENDILRDALTAAQAEEACLREDAQNAVFRNGVLSQQVTSLLVKVERLRQELRAAPARSQGTHKDPGSHTLPGQSPALACGASPASPSPSPSSLSQRRPFTVPSEMQTQPRTGLRQHTVAWGGPRDAVNTSAACAAAVASQALLDRRSREGGSAWLLLNGSPSVLDRNASISNASPLSEPMHRLSTFTLRGTDAALQRPVRQTAVASAHAAEERSGDRVRDPFLSFSDGVVTPLSARDLGEPASAASFTRPAASSWSTLEVERGVSRTLRTLGRRTWTRSFAVDDTAADDSVCPNEEDGVNGSEVGQPRREASASSSSTAHRQGVCALRNLGSGVVGVSLPCVPRLPASDCLSGVALGRPSAYSVPDPRTGAARRQLTSAEATLRTRSEGSGASSTVNKASRAPASQAAIADEASSLPLVEESAEDVLAILDMLKNEDLGGLERHVPEMQHTCPRPRSLLYLGFVMGCFLRRARRSWCDHCPRCVHGPWCDHCPRCVHGSCAHGS